MADFPTNVQDFDGDDRISFSRLDNKFLAVQDDGTEFEFDADRKVWKLFEEHAFDDEAHDALHQHEPDTSVSNSNGKRRHGGDDGETGGQERDSQPKSRPNKKQKAPPQPKQNTAVYVTGLPTDATVDEVHELFSRKGGVIAEEIDSGAPRIKMYAGADGEFKGDALIVFFKPQSVEMAIMLLDDTDFRITPSGTREGRIRVQEADSSYKKVQYDNDAAGGEGSASNDQRSETRKPRTNDRQKIIKKTQKMDAKLADWSDDESPAAAANTNAKRDKTVVLEHMFTLQELEEDPAALLDIKEDIRDECSKLGTVTSVVLFDQEQDGIVTVKFKESESAMACINLMHGRAFDGRTVQAYLATGKEGFRKSKADKDGEE